MIKLKSSNNVQTFYIAKGCSDVCISDNTLPMGSYTKAEADERFQPKGDYPTVEDVNIIKEDLENNIDELSNSLSSEIAELEVSKQETFQVNQPLYFERSDEDLTLNVNLEDYATKEDLENIDVSGKQDLLVSGVNIKTINNESILGSGNINTKYTAGENISILDSEISWEAPEVQFVNTIFTDDEMLKYAIADFKGGYTEKEFPLATTESAGLMSPEDKAKLDAASSGDTIPYLYIIPSGYQYKLGDGDYDAVKNAVINDTPCLIYWVNNTTSGTTATYGDFVALFEAAEWNNTTSQLEVRFHFEEGTTHIHRVFGINNEGTVSTSTQIHNYVNQTDYDTKVSEIDTAISDLQTQIGDISTVLDNINGEII